MNTNQKPSHRAQQSDVLEADIMLVKQYAHLELDEIACVELREAVIEAQVRVLEAMNELVEDTRPLAKQFGLPCETLEDVEAVLARVRI